MEGENGEAGGREEGAIANRNQERATAAPPAPAASEANGASGGQEDGEKKKKKKRERKADEVDEIFAKAKKTKTDAEPVSKKVQEVAKPKKNREEELGDVLQAIKASM